MQIYFSLILQHEDDCERRDKRIAKIFTALGKYGNPGYGTLACGGEILSSRTTILSPWVSVVEAMFKGANPMNLVLYLTASATVWSVQRLKSREPCRRRIRISLHGQPDLSACTSWIMRSDNPPMVLLFWNSYNILLKVYVIAFGW